MPRAQENLKEIRIAKQKACDILVKLGITKPTKKQVEAVASTVAQTGLPLLTYQKFRRTWLNFINYGYYDGSAKDLHTDRKISAAISTHNYNNYHAKSIGRYKYLISPNKIKVTPAKAWEAISLWLSGATYPQVYNTVGINAQTLLSLIHEYADKGSLCGKTLCEPLQHDIFTVRALALNKHVFKKPNRTIDKKRMSVEYRRITARTIKSYDNFKIKSRVLIKENLNKKINPMHKAEEVKKLA
jgi:hypothetical protein